MVMECLECNYKCGTLFNLAFHYNIEHWDKIGEDESLIGICIEIFRDSVIVRDDLGDNSNKDIAY